VWAAVRVVCECAFVYMTRACIVLLHTYNTTHYTTPHTTLITPHYSVFRIPFTVVATPYTYAFLVARGFNLRVGKSRLDGPKSETFTTFKKWSE
jgi:hypothetical protein